MVFSSLTFLCIFLPIVFILHCLLPSIRMKNALLIIASLLFYAYGEPVYVVLMIGSTIFNYVMGLIIGGERRGGKKFCMVLSVIVNLGLLGVFKYLGMLFATANNLFGLDIQGPSLALPIGISFYTFQAMSYVIDVYRGKVESQKNYFNVLLYISFFPQLIAGPIVKYHDIQEQIMHRTQKADQIAKGLQRFIIGLSKKVLISNVVALAADHMFALDIAQMNVFSAWIAAVSYMLQIYYDFSGYSDMAIGLGQMFGFQFLENFQYPYASTSIQVFWRRWHISLSTWFKEYLYIPLGGNRKGRGRTWLNRWIVFFCTGLWHGANWTFVAWGLYHGFFLFIEDLFGSIGKGRKKEATDVPKRRSPVIRFIGHIYVLIVVCMGFVVFRADSIMQGVGVAAKMFTGWNLDALSNALALQECTPLFLFILVIAMIGQFPWLPKLKEKVKVPAVIGYLIAVVLLILCMLSLSSGTYNPFIYFRF